ncbi:hypothetical protein BX666DRAFT_1947670 [Dichotomocladium elegans]|nr:hypothetical protein BX666DRAFT_1947670 [Dichotomocladium elegans]
MSLFSKFSKNSSDKSGVYPWTQRKLSGSHLSSMLPRFGHATSIALPGEQVVLFGGAHIKSKKDLFVIDTNTMAATYQPATGDIPTPRMYAALAPLGSSCILLYGGEPTSPDEKWDPHFYTLNLGTRQWTRIYAKDARLPTERAGHSLVSVGDSLYVWGGHRAGRYLNDMFVFNTNTYQWDYINPSNEGPAGRAGHTCICFENTLYIFGGSDGKHLYNDIWSFDLQRYSWKQVTAVGYIPVPRERCAAAMVGDVMYIFGGHGPDSQELGDLCAFKVRALRWFMFQNMGPAPSARFGSTLTALGDKLIAIGGDSFNGKLEEPSSVIHVLDCSKIRYPPDQPATEPDAMRTSPRPPESAHHEPQMASTNTNSTNNTQTTTSSRPHSHYPEVPQQASQRPPRHMSMVSSAAGRRQLAPSPLPPQEALTDLKPHHATMSPPASAEATTSNDSKSREEAMPNAPQTIPQRPPRPQRSGSLLKNGGSSSKIPRKDTVSMFPDTAPRLEMPQDMPGMPRVGASDKAANDDVERLLRDIRALDGIITSMRKKESWWRGEVSISRRMRFGESPNDVEADEEMLIELNDKLGDTQQLKLFEHLISIKAELRRVQSSIGGPASHQAMSDRIHQVDRIKTAALQEAAYWKSKCMGRSKGEDPVHMLEQRLAYTLMENEQQQRLLQHLKKQAQHDHAAFESAQERAKEAHERAIEAQEAHERVLQELELLHHRATQAETSVRTNGTKMADLRKQLEECTSKSSVRSDLDAAQAQVVQLKQANEKVRSEAVALEQELRGCTEDIEHLRMALKEREDALNAASSELSHTAEKLHRVKESMMPAESTVVSSTAATYAFQMST